MELRRLYYEDPHQKTFDATVLTCTETEKGWEITLDATAFYPEGGGQPCDRGTLGESSVLFVRDAGEQIVHLCDRPLPVGSTVTGNIDWDFRFDCMQQHSGEHMVSGVVHQRFGYHNVGFHMGSELVTIDFDGPIPMEALQEIENTVNAAIWENRQVKCWYPSREELPTVPYRRKKDLPWPVRIVEFPGLDVCACCGTQVAYTGEIGLVKLLSCVKFHEGVRIEMVCGGRAMAYLTEIYNQNRLVSQAFSAKPTETGTAAQRMNETLAAEKFRATALEKRLFAAIAEGYAGKSAVLHFEDALSSAANRELCDAIVRVCPMAITLAGTDESGYSLCIFSQDDRAKELGQQAVSALGGRGGGKPNAFQGTLSATKSAITAFFDAFFTK